jgi:hypothetical protein
MLSKTNLRNGAVAGDVVAAIKCNAFTNWSSLSRSALESLPIDFRITALSRCDRMKSGSCRSSLMEFMKDSNISSFERRASREDRPGHTLHSLLRHLANSLTPDASCH